jgi:hypothetical protein
VKTVVLVLIAALSTFAQTVGKGKQVVLDAVEGMGGPKFLSMKNRIETGRAFSFYREQVTGLSLATIYTEYLDHVPPKGLAVREREAFGKKQDYSVLFLEDQGYEINFRGARPVSDETWKKYEKTTGANIFYLMRQRLNDPKLSYDFVRSDVVLNTQVNIIDIADGSDNPIRVYFDGNTKLPIRQESSAWDPVGRGRTKEVTDYSKYREVNGVQWPYVIHRERNGEVIYEIFAHSVEIDATIPPKTFDLPTGIKILKKVD